MPRLRRSNSAEPGITRRRHGRGFAYRTAGGALEDADALARIKALAIPPAWTEVWICAAPNGHIQAVGTDAAGRRQYLYHEQWRRSRDEEKHRRVTELAAALPDARRTVIGHLRHRTMDRERALAVAFRLLDIGSFRIGSEAYASSNGTYGIATMRREQVEVQDDQLHLEFPGKGSKQIDWVAKDRALSRAIEELVNRVDRTEELLAWQCDDGSWRDVKSSDVNEYVREVTGGDYTAKDFRTWNATVLMAAELATAEPSRTTRTARERCVREAVKRVAEHLNNTPSVARSAYIDRRVIDLYLDGVTVDLPTPTVGGAFTSRHREDLEDAVLRMLRDPARKQRGRKPAAEERVV
jgi:DNA topoisomerase I